MQISASNKERQEKRGERKRRGIYAHSVLFGVFFFVALFALGDGVFFCRFVHA